MNEITVKLNDEMYEGLERQAIKHGLSTEEELKRILAQNIEAHSEKRLSRQEFLQWAKDFSKQAGPQKTNSTDIIRDLRENS